MIHWYISSQRWCSCMHRASNISINLWTARVLPLHHNVFPPWGFQDRAEQKGLGIWLTSPWCITVIWIWINVKRCMIHYIDVIMTTNASQVTSRTVVYSTVYSDADQRKHQSSASLAFVWGIHRDRWIPRTSGQLRGKCFHLMTSLWQLFSRYLAHLQRVMMFIQNLVSQIFGLISQHTSAEGQLIFLPRCTGTHYDDVIMGAIVSQITNPTIGTGEFPARMASNAENVSISWRHHGISCSTWWHYDVIRVSALLVICVENPQVSRRIFARNVGN